MKIIFCTSTYSLNNSGGMDKVLYSALPEFDKRGIDYLVIASNKKYDVLKGLVKLILNNPFSFNVIVFNSLAAISKRYNKYWRIYFFLSLFLGWNKALYWHEMSTYFDNFSKQNPAESKLIIKSFNKRNVIHLAVSESNSHIIDDFFPKGIKRIVYNTCKPISISGKNTFLYPTVLSIGSIQYIKGTDIWTKVAIGVCKRNENAHFLWCGGVNDMKLYEDCKGLISENNLSDRIQFLGRINNPGILIHSAHLFYLPSRSDSMPLVVLEAMASGRDIIYYNSGGAKEAVGDYGIYIENFDVEETIERILAYLNQNKNTEAITENRDLMERYSSRFTPFVFVDKFLDELGKAIINK